MKRRKYQKSTAFIAVSLLLILLLPLLSGCAPKAAPPSTDAIPEGWEVVSTNGNVQYLQLKEGSDAYHYKEVKFYNYEYLDYEMDVVFPNHPDRTPLSADANGNVHLLLYYGYLELETNETKTDYFLSTMPSTAEKTNYAIGMSPLYDYIGHEPPTIPLENFGAEYTLKFELTEAGSPSTARIGFTQAVLISLPISEFHSGWDSFAFDIFKYEESEWSDWEDCLLEPITFRYCTFNDTIYFKTADLENTLFSFPYAFFTHYRIIDLLLFAFAIGLTVWCICKRNPLPFSLLPCIAGVVYNHFAMIWFGTLPDQYSDGSLLPFLLQYFFAFLLGVLLLIQVIAVFARRRKTKKHTWTKSSH